MTMTGCDTADPVPTGEALYADAEQTYMDYREFVNGVQSVLSTGPWIVGQIGDYGMQPDSCDDGNGYQFNMGRRLAMDLADREQNADAVEQYLTDAGLSPSRRTLGEGKDSLVQIAVADERGFELLLVEFRKNGNAQISAATTCRPGDAHDLSDMLFGEEVFLGGYLPSDFESPTDPLFFGITPGDPKFATETPAP
jgi:hypothetical protein